MAPAPRTGAASSLPRLQRVIDAGLAAAAALPDDKASQVKAVLVLTVAHRCKLLHSRWVACSSTCPVVVQNSGRSAVQAVPEELQATFDQRYGQTLYAVTCCPLCLWF